MGVTPAAALEALLAVGSLSGLILGLREFWRKIIQGAKLEIRQPNIVDFGETDPPEVYLVMGIGGAGEGAPDYDVNISLELIVPVRNVGASEARKVTAEIIEDRGRPAEHVGGQREVQPVSFPRTLLPGDEPEEFQLSLGIHMEEEEVPDEFDLEFDVWAVGKGLNAAAARVRIPFRDGSPENPLLDHRPVSRWTVATCKLAVLLRQSDLLRKSDWLSFHIVNTLPNSRSLFRACQSHRSKTDN